MRREPTCFALCHYGSFPPQTRENLLPAWIRTFPAFLAGWDLSSRLRMLVVIPRKVLSPAHNKLAAHNERESYQWTQISPFFLRINVALRTART